jgi:hypothetical protein
MALGTDRTQYREVLASLVQKTQTRFPALNGRLTNATKLALLDDVELHDDGSATVSSASDPTRRYEIREGVCSCQDYARAPEHLCQHRLAAGLVRKAHALLPPAPDGLGIPDTTPLPEAPCSVNVHVTIAGRPVQVTLRGHDEGEVLSRLEALLQRYPPQQPPPQASSQGEGWCAVHNCTMQENVKHGQRWFSHKKEDGSWCKGQGR